MKTWCWVADGLRVSQHFSFGQARCAQEKGHGSHLKSKCDPKMINAVRFLDCKDGHADLSEASFGNAGTSKASAFGRAGDEC